MARILEKNLTKMQVRKLNALRKSLGKTIADKAFAEWLKTQKPPDLAKEDPNAKLIEGAITKLIATKKLKIPQRGYLITRGRGKVKVTEVAGPKTGRQKAGAAKKTSKAGKKRALKQSGGKKAAAKKGPARKAKA